MKGLFIGPYHNATRLKHHSQRQYPNKGANVEYYTDEKNNIRRRRINRG